MDIQISGDIVMNMSVQEALRLQSAITTALLFMSESKMKKPIGICPLKVPVIAIVDGMQCLSGLTVAIGD